MLKRHAWLAPGLLVDGHRPGTAHRSYL